MELPLENDGSRDDPDVAPDSDERVLDILLTTFSRHGWRDSSIEHFCRTTGYGTELFDRRWPRGIDDVFVELYDRRTETARTEIALALLALRRHTATPSVDELFETLELVTRSTWTDQRWCIACAEYAARLMRYPELAQPYLDRRRAHAEVLCGIVEEYCDMAGFVAVASVDQMIDLLSTIDSGIALGGSGMFAPAAAASIRELAWAGARRVVGQRTPPSGERSAGP